MENTFSRVMVMNCILATMLLCAFPALAQTDACGRTRADLEEALLAGVSAQDLSDQHNDCLGMGIFGDGFETGDTTGWSSVAKQETTPTGSITYEEIDACGYHPQRRELDCAVELKQRFGFAGAPGAGPGSWEWIQFCVDYGVGLVPVNVSAVHVHDEPFGDMGPWYYGVSVAADTSLHQALTNGQTLIARAILSWTLIPNSCSYTPPWGNQADFRIKLDP